MKTILRKTGCIYCVIAPNTRELARIFVRLQEFYESPFKEIRGNYFTLKEFKAIYSKDKDGVFTYYDDWAGFNVPGHVVVEFFKRFTDLSPKERMLKKLLLEALTQDEKFYVIGVQQRNNRATLEHEIAHALFYTNPVYKKTMLKHGRKLSPRVRKQVFDKLKKMGYCGIVRYDELQAYMATSRLVDLIHWFGQGIIASHSKPFKHTFKKWHR